MVTTPSNPEVKISLYQWLLTNMPDERYRYAGSAVRQINWVQGELAQMVWHSLLPSGKGELSYEQRRDTLTVDGTHFSKSVLLPVYRFDVAGVTTKIRGNFHDWCVRCWTPLKKPFPEYMNLGFDRGYFEGMSHEESPVAFCANNKEQLYAALWWMYNEGIK
jgi:hypothetical protein